MDEPQCNAHDASTATSVMLHRPNTDDTDGKGQLIVVGKGSGDKEGRGEGRQGEGRRNVEVMVGKSPEERDGRIR